MNQTSPATVSFNVAAMIWRNARLKPDSPACVTSRGVITYRQLSSMIAVVAVRLADAGVAPGAMVGLSFQLSLQHIIAMLAIAHAGGVSVPLHPAWTPVMREATANRYNVSHIITQDARYVPEGFDFTLFNDELLKSAPNKPAPPCRLDAAAPFRVAMSANVAGDPKGVVFSHGYMRRRMAQTGCAWTATSRLLPADLNFTAGFVFALSLLASGGMLVFPESMKPVDLARTVNANAVSHLFISPAVATQMTSQLKGKGLYFPTLQQLRVIGPPPSRALLEELSTRFSPNVIVPYAVSELGVIALATADMLKAHPDAAGKVVPWATVEIVDDSGAVLPAGAAGRVRITCEGLPAGYQEDAPGSAGRFRDGWFYPGERGRLSGDGLLTLEGRSGIIS